MQSIKSINSIHFIKKNMSHCRVDVSNAVSTSSWLKIPYPLRWGFPIFHFRTCIVMVIVSMVTSMDSGSTLSLWIFLNRNVSKQRFRSLNMLVVTLQSLKFSCNCKNISQMCLLQINLVSHSSDWSSRMLLKFQYIQRR